MADSPKTPESIYDELADSLNIAVVTIDRAKNLVKTWLAYSNFEQPRTLQLGLIGESGVGKTQCVKQALDELGTHYLIVLRISNMDEGQLNGYPTPTDKKTIRLCMLDQYKEQIDECKSQGKKLVIMFDELNRGKAQTIRTVFNIVERKIWAGEQLPLDTAFIVATNPPTGIHQVQDIWGEEAALNSRFNLIGVKTHVAGFLNYIKGNDRFHWVMREFIENNPMYLEDFQNMYAGKKYTCPAVIECIGEYLYNAEEAGEDLSKILDSTTGLKDLIRGAGGTPFASDVFNFVSNMKQNINPILILEDYEKVRDMIVRASSFAERDLDDMLTSRETDDLDCTQVVMLAKKVAEYIGSHNPDLGSDPKHAHNIAAFMDDIPDDPLTAFMETLYTSAKRDDSNRGYLVGFTKALMPFAEYKRAADRLIKSSHSTNSY